ncbi:MULTISPECIES: DUF6221 family protein [unclassified Streptomyces]|uniref:DUF6221 family protein n=1 Tax=unclassified Streptomyces TaxID=2593676 RepID=UPI0036E734A3
MEDLVQWLGSQLDEDERIAKAAPSGPWTVDSAGSVVDADGGRVIPSVGGALNGRTSRWPEGPAVDHILRQEPGRALSEIDAKRKLLVLHRPVRRTDFTTSDGSPAGTLVVCHECDANSTDADWPDSPCWTLRLLAVPYADRPGYKEDWRP